MKKDYNKEHMAKAIGRGLPISTKHAVEICSFIRNKNLGKAKEILGGVIEKKQAIPFRRFKQVGHKKEIGPGRYPKKASQQLLKLLNAIEVNAQFKGLDISSLVIKSIVANKAAKMWHYGRKRRRKMKRTHIEVIAEEKPTEKKGKKIRKNQEKTKND